MDKPFAPASERNREPILAVLREHFAGRRRVLEIGSGTGQHAVHFATALPHLIWQASDREANLPGIRMWLAEAALPNTPPPIALDVNGAWPKPGTSAEGPPRGASCAPSGGSEPATAANVGVLFDAVFSANTLHIMGWDDVVTMFARLPEVVERDATLAIYGPFNYAGRYTSVSNAAFDAQLKAADRRQGLRDAEAVAKLARDAGFTLAEDRAMPANNRMLVFRQPA